MAVSQNGFATTGAAARGGPQAGKSSAKLTSAKFTKSQRGALDARKLGGGTPKPGKPAK